MLQFINCSKEVLYNKQKSHSELLLLINATVSHELRNPLNSIVAQNIQKQALNTELMDLVEKSDLDIKIKKRMKEAFTKIERGCSI